MRRLFTSESVAEGHLDKICDQIMIYPPGIPLLNPEEWLTKQVADEYLRLIEDGNKFVGSIENGAIKIKVIKE